MQSALQLWARSSMAEQWPFKPFVESSTLSELTEKVFRFGRLFVLLRVPAGGMIFDPLCEAPRGPNSQKALRARAFLSLSDSLKYLRITQ